MPRVYELPTHLQVEDTLIAGLTARQLVRLAVCASFAYAAWDQLGWLPAEPRLILALCLVTVGIVTALVRPAGRPLDQWALAIVAFHIAPRHRIWRTEPPCRRMSTGHQKHWAELDLEELGWMTTSRTGATTDPNSACDATDSRWLRWSHQAGLRQ